MPNQGGAGEHFRESPAREIRLLMSLIKKAPTRKVKSTHRCNLLIMQGITSPKNIF